MMTRHFRLLAGGTVLSTLGFVALALSTGAEVPATVDTYQGTANAAGVHVIGYSDADPSFSSGAIDNRYPLAAVHQDSAPSSAARGSTQDYGPVAGTVFASDAPQPPAPAPQIPYPPHQPPPAVYANAHYPGTKADQDATFSQSGGQADYAHADAGELFADSSSYYAGNQTTVFNNATAESHTVLKPDGSITVTTHSHVGSASFGAGVIQIANVDVTTKVTSAGGVASATATVAPGTVTVNNTPVQLSDQGVTVGDQSQSLNGVSATTPVFHIFVVAPQKTVSGNRAAIDASGVHVGITQPARPGTPTQYTEYILGQGQGEAELTPAQAVTSSSSTDTSFLPTDSSGTVSPVTTIINNTVAAPAINPDTTSGTTAPAAPVAPRTRPRVVSPALVRVVKPPLAYMFFLWEALILGATASAVWARRAAGAPR